MPPVQSDAKKTQTIALVSMVKMFGILMNYQHTRIMYDDLTTHNRKVISETPVKYYTSLFTNNRRLKEPVAENISASNDLRMKPTRLNYINRPQTELYGTAPFKGKNNSGVIDVDSELRYAEYAQHCNRSLSERTWETNEYINAPLAVEQIRPHSTRAELRNNSCK